MAIKKEASYLSEIAEGAALKLCSKLDRVISKVKRDVRPRRLLRRLLRECVERTEKKWEPKCNFGGVQEGERISPRTAS